MFCPEIHSTFIAIDLTSNHLWIFKLSVFLHLFPHLLQSTCYPIMQVSNIKIVRSPAIHSTIIAIDLTSDHLWIFKLSVFLHLFPHFLQSIRYPIMQVSNIEIVRCPAFHSTFIAIDMTSDYLWIFKFFLVTHLFPHSLQLTCHPIIFQI